MMCQQKPTDFTNRLVAETIRPLNSKKQLDLTSLYRIWEAISKRPGDISSKIFILLAERARAQGAPLLAYDAVSEGLRYDEKNVRMRQLLGLAHADLKATKQAYVILLELYIEGKRDGESLGILARSFKDLWEKERNPAKKKKWLRESHRYYLEGYQYAIIKKKGKWIDDAIYTGINAASTAMLLGKRDYAQRLAKEVNKICIKKPEKNRDYWTMASMGEAALIMGKFEEAEDKYSQAGEIGNKNYRNLSGTRKQARIILDYLGIDKHKFDHCFSIPKVVVFTGHMIDRPGRLRPRFPQALEKVVIREIDSRLNKLGKVIGYSSAACGSDIIFLEEMLKRKNEINIVLPFLIEGDKGEPGFKGASVDIIPGSEWGKRFDRVLKKAASVGIVNERRNTENIVAYEYSNLSQAGLAIMRARMLDTEVIPLVVWDGYQGDGPWGTYSCVKYWERYGLKYEHIDTTGLLKETIMPQPKRKKVKTESYKDKNKTKSAPGFSQKIMAMLFADVVGYSKLREEKIPGFVQYFMGAIADLLMKYPYKPLTKKTWGDAIYFAFSNVGDAGNFALLLRDHICNMDWEKKGLPKDLNLRISVHAGPVYCCKDPVLKKIDFTGSHVNRAARIEPITPPGEVYASQEFAALAAANSVNEFTCEYVGQIPLPKKSGIIPLYLVRANPL